MRLLLNKSHFPVTALGPGRRIGLWFQGCSIGCPGCISQDTWAPDASFETTVEEVLAWARGVAGAMLDGVTISGGEPFEQPQALARLVEALCRWREDDGLDFDILAYSGMPLSRLRRTFPSILGQLDAIISEPFVARLAPGAPGLGSSNQRLTLLSERGRAAHARHSDTPRSIQVSVDGQSIWVIGVPLPGDMERVEALAAARGLQWKGASWRG